MQADVVARAEQLRQLHAGPGPLLLPNAWDVGSALAVVRAGATAVATTSSAVAAALGYPDGEAIPADDMLTAVARIAAAVDVPVTADLEAGYGLPADALVERLVAAGGVGMNLEDTVRHGGTPELGPIEPQVERIAAIRSAAAATGVPLVINARIDSYLRADSSGPDTYADALVRGRAYLGAGADCVYPIMLADAEVIGRFVAEVGGPVNILRRPGSPSVAELTALGVRRISVGGGLWRHAMERAEGVARDLLAGQDGAFGELGEG